MTAFDARIQREFIKRVRALEQRAVDYLCGGRLEDFGEYKHHTGYIAALKDVSEALEAARKAVITEGKDQNADSSDKNPRIYG